MKLQEPLLIPIGNHIKKSVSELKRPKSYTPGQLANAGLEMLDLSWLRCMSCGAAWSPNLRTGGRLPRNYWKCPNGCNAEAK